MVSHYTPAMLWWYWLVGGLVLLALELATPSGFFMLFFGLGALTVGVLAGSGVVSAPWLQWLIFTASAVGYLLAFRGRLRTRFDSPGSAMPVDSLVGDRGSVTVPMAADGEGRVEVRGSSWLARNTEAVPLEAGRRCRVVRVEGLTLFVAAD